jgi:hypothetical protein
MNIGQQALLPFLESGSTYAETRAPEVRLRTSDCGNIEVSTAVASTTAVQTRAASRCVYMPGAVVAVSAADCAAPTGCGEQQRQLVPSLLLRQHPIARASLRSRRWWRSPSDSESLVVAAFERLPSWCPVNATGSLALTLRHAGRRDSTAVRRVGTVRLPHGTGAACSLTADRHSIRLQTALPLRRHGSLPSGVVPPLTRLT